MVTKLHLLIYFGMICTMTVGGDDVADNSELHVEWSSKALAETDL